MDFKQLMKDKRVWAGAAVVAAIAAVAVIRNRGGGGSAGSGANPVNPSGYYQAAGAVDTTGTDISSFLGNWGEAQAQAQQQFLTNLTTALGQGGAGQNDDPPPAVVFTRDPATGKPLWALLNSPYGGWMQTDSQATANSWAAQWGGDDNTADTVDWSAWQKLKDKWNK